jgi:hypothetical protein
MIVRGIAVGEIAADRRAVSHQRIGDQRNRVGKNRIGRADQLGALERGLARGAADAHEAAVLLDVLEAGDAADVDEMLEGAEAQLQHRQQAHAAGENFRLLAVAREQADRFIERTRTVVVECRWNHPFLLCAPG